MKKILIVIITTYQKTISLDQGALPKFFGVQKKVCMFYPTCSEFAKEAINKYGMLKGSRLSLGRIARCNPLSTPRVDLVP